MRLTSKQSKNHCFNYCTYLAFIVVIAAKLFSGKDMHILYYYIICVAIQIAAMMLCKDKPATTLFVFAVLGITAYDYRFIESWHNCYLCFFL
jgi:FHS family L-fucose permease-like MFS transporter